MAVAGLQQRLCAVQIIASSSSSLSHLTAEERELLHQPASEAKVICRLRLCTYRVAVHARSRTLDQHSRPKRAVGRGRVTKAVAGIGRNIALPILCSSSIWTLEHANKSY